MELSEDKAPQNAGRPVFPNGRQNGQPRGSAPLRVLPQPPWPRPLVPWLTPLTPARVPHTHFIWSLWDLALLHLLQRKGPRRFCDAQNNRCGANKIPH